jgi:hypothetical protein
VTAIEASAAVRPCSRCALEPRLPRQRWGRRCLTLAQRTRRAAQRSARPSVNPVTKVPSAAQEPADSGAMLALDRYHRAVAELDRAARDTDWRLSRYQPSTVLAPLQRAVTQAADACRRLGVPEAAWRA